MARANVVITNPKITDRGSVCYSVLPDILKSIYSQRRRFLIFILNLLKRNAILYISNIENIRARLKSHGFKTWRQMNHLRFINNKKIFQLKAFRHGASKSPNPTKPFLGSSFGWLSEYCDSRHIPKWACQLKTLRKWKWRFTKLGPKVLVFG